MTSDKVAILFDIDGTLIVTDGAGSTSWSMAFKEIYNIDAQIDRYSDIGMTDPEVARRTFEAVIGRAPTKAEFSRLLERRMHYLTESVQDSKGYHVLPGVEDLLPKLIAQGYL
ncbi:phosphatase, partial [mine drainage metagenome]